MEEIYIILGVLTTISGVISTLLNPISFYYHFIKRSTTSARLYCLLAATDFATNLIFPFFLAYRFFSDRPQENNGFRKATTTEKALLAVFDAPSYFTGVVVSTIAIVRFIAVKYPFYMIRNKPLFFYMFATFLFFFIRFMFDAFSDDLEWCPYTEYAIDYEGGKDVLETREIFALIASVIYIGSYVLGTFASIGTVALVIIKKLKRRYLTQGTGQENRIQMVWDAVKLSSAVFISNMLVPIFIVATLGNESFIDECKGFIPLYVALNILSLSVFAIISSALDPIFVIIFSKEMRIFLKQKLFVT